jgi:carboxylate-amine ligase
VSPIDLAAAEVVFAESADGTVGLEEEFAILDPETLALAPRFEQLRDSAEPALAEHLAGELIRSEIEVVSGRGEDLGDALARQREARRMLFAHAAAQGAALGSTGTHPWSDYREQQFIDTEHYRRVADSLRYVAKRNNTFSLHVHVGVNGLDRAVRVCDRLRPLLPTLLAIGASSPYVDAIDSGLHSARTQIFTKSFPRCGVPDAYGGWPAYRDYLRLLIDTGSIVEYTQVWWSVRPHLTFGTVEVRICDAQTTAAESEALAALIVACVNAAARDIDEGVPFADPAPRLIEENMWRAIRHGMDGELIDLERGAVEPARATLERLMGWAGADIAFPELNSAQRQRRLIEAATPMEEVYAQLVAETRATYAGETVGHHSRPMTTLGSPDRSGRT